MTAIHVPDELRRNVTTCHGRAGVQWLDALPAILDACAARWSLRLGLPFTPLSYNYVMAAERADRTPAVLKVGVPCRELETEAAALRVYDGRGCARLLEADTQLGALLIERLEPGTPLSAGLVTETDDEEATVTAASVMRELWRPAPDAHEFPRVSDWGAGFNRLRARFGGGSGPFPPALVREAESLFAELLETAAAPVLLHGDLHHYNILAAGRDRWLAIDPKGVVGEPAFEVTALMHNPAGLLEMRRPVEVLGRRVELLARELNLERARVRGWGIAGLVLSAWWSFEDHGEGWERGVECARLLAAVKE
ncbi:MAG TPA: aminoglycoside phosphotransferase family protein [Pyrinomonadaceae bacterium]